MTYRPSIAQQEFSWIKTHRFTLPIHLIIVLKEWTGMEGFQPLQEQVKEDTLVMFHLIFTNIHILDHDRRKQQSFPKAYHDCHLRTTDGL